MIKMRLFAAGWFLSAVLWIIPVSLVSGTVDIKSGTTVVMVKQSGPFGLKVKSSVTGFSMTEVQTPAGLFSMIRVDGFGYRQSEGEPALPVFRKLTEVPVNASFSVRVTRMEYRDFDLGAMGKNHLVFPAQPTLSKGDDPEKVPFVYNKEFYQADQFLADEMVTITHVGTLRSLVLARIDISPVQYNPVTGILRIYDEVEADIVFVNPDFGATRALKQQKASPWFGGLYRTVDNYDQGCPADALITSAPATYVIVSDPMFQIALQPFIDWKKKKGFRVIEGYTNNPSVGNTTTSIKTWLQNLYTNPPAGTNAPSFVLLVGDVAQIPAWSGGAGSHVTDLRYCEYTNDNLPEVFYGRFSATTVAQLQPQIDKTLEYEQYLMPDPSFLGRAVMVAGADGSFQTHSNGQIYYGTETYFNAAHGIYSHTYLQPEPSGGNYSQNIKNNVSEGVAYANYTAHCGSSGWGDPSFVISDIPALTNNGKYCLMVGNCCLSAKFDVTSFAEEQLRAANKGAVGYIGGSNNTYWDEDFWWGCGFKNVVLHPAYNASHLGVYDGVFHDHGEPVTNWFITQGQMPVCGNLAVEESNSSRKQYYWEIYHLMGDPSLMIYFSVPPALTANYANPLMIGMNTLAVTTQPYAYIALSMNGTLLTAAMADASGAATLTFAPLTIPGIADIVITKQNRQPWIGTIQVIPASGPYVMVETVSLSDPAPGGNNNGLMDFGEINHLNITLKNVGIQSANNVHASLSTTSSHITITDGFEAAGTIAPGQSVTLSGGFTYQVANNIPDQLNVPFTLQVTDGTNSWNSDFQLTGNAPQMAVGAMTVIDNCPTCNADGILDPGETANLPIVVQNNGHAGVTDVEALLAIQGGASPYLVINNAGSMVGNIGASGTGNAIFSVTADPATPIGTPVNLHCSVTAGVNAQYTANEDKELVIGLIPEFVMNSATITTCTGYFYDPGGLANPYSNNQDYTMTFHPASPGSVLKVVFSSFALEPHPTCNYDYLKIYNGSNTAAPLLGTWCGTNSPGTILAENATGSLTFVFHSDISVTGSGWVAAISCLSGLVPNPAAFAASAVSNNQIDLSWTANPSGHPVMLVCSMNNIFGNPAEGISYSPGSILPGGGTVLATSGANVYHHTGLGASTVYYYKAFSCDPSYHYSSGVSASANTACGTITLFPYSEGFENSGSIPPCWAQEYVTLPGFNWTFVKGNGGSSPGTAHSGNYNACFKDNSSADNKTMLISPCLNLSGLPQPQLKFWHTQAYWSPDQDYLTVYYRNSPSGSWTLLAAYTNNITSWTQETIALPNASESYYIAFEGNAKYGYGVCVDDVEVSSNCPNLYPVSLVITASQNPVDTGIPVTFTATPVNGGSAPVYQWQLNGINILGASGAVHTYIPENGDVITCRMTSDLGCAAGNPAMSNAITMAVLSVPPVLSVQDTTIWYTECFDALDTITVAGEGHFFRVTGTGHATFIAGKLISFLPGTIVEPGGALYGRIAPEGPFCMAPTMVTTVTTLVEPELSIPDRQVRFFPNPVTDRITVIATGWNVGPIDLVVYNMQGTRIMVSTLLSESSWHGTLAGYPSGLYILTLSQGSNQKYVRVIKI